MRDVSEINRRRLSARPRLTLSNSRILEVIRKYGEPEEKEVSPAPCFPMSFRLPSFVVLSPDWPRRYSQADMSSTLIESRIDYIVAAAAVIGDQRRREYAVPSLSKGRQ